MNLVQYLTLGGQEVSNGNRVAAYVRNVGDNRLLMTEACNCHLLTDDIYPFLSPEEDCAPWVDDDIPASSEYLGFAAYEINLNPVAAREVTPKAQVGASVGASRLNPRTVNVSGIMFASTPRGMAYGERWMAEVLRGNLCATGCSPDEARVLPACVEGSTEADFRKLVNVGVVDGPVFVPLGSGVPECVIERASFVLVSSMPWLYGLVERCLDEEFISTAQHCALETTTWNEGTFVITVENMGTTDATGIEIVGRLSLDGSCPVASPGTSVPPLWSYTIPILKAGDKVTIDGTRRQALYYDASYKIATSALPVMDFAGAWKWPDAPACQTVCLSMESGSGAVAGSVETYTKEL